MRLHATLVLVFLATAVHVAAEDIVEEDEVIVDTVSEKAKEDSPDLRAEFAEKRQRMTEMSGGEDFHFSRMATPVRTKRERAERLRSREMTDQEKRSAGQMFVPTETEATVQRDLGRCLVDLQSRPNNTYYDSLECYETAVERFDYNSTWWKRIGTLHLLSSSPVRAIASYNKSVGMVFSLARYRTTSEELLKDGGVGFLKLFSYRDIRSSLEAGKLMAVNATYHYRLKDAMSIYENFLLEEGRADDDMQLLWTYVEALAAQGDWARIPRVVDKVADLEEHLSGLPPMLLTLRLIGDAIDLAAKRLLLMHTAPPSPETVAETDKYIRGNCGRGDLPLLSTYTRAELVAFLVQCFEHQTKKGGVLFTKLQNEAKVLKQDRAGFLQGTPLHFVAALGGRETRLLETIIKMGVEVHATTRFGHTALHLALAGGHFVTAKALLAQRASLSDKDFRQLTPVDIACRHAAWINRVELGKLMDEDPSEDPCEIDDEPVVTHVKTVPREEYGGWGTSGKPPRVMSAVWKTVESVMEPPPPVKGDHGQCQIDVRDGSISGMDLLADYLLVGRPVLLRGAMPEKKAKRFAKEALLRRVGKMKGRVEAFPMAELSGKTGVRVMTLQAFLDFQETTPEVYPSIFTEKLPRLNPKRVAAEDASVIPTRHPLQNLTKWRPAFLDFEGFRNNDAHQEVYFTVGPPGSGMGAEIQTLATIHIMPFGSRRWFLRPPTTAFTSRIHPLRLFMDNSKTWRKRTENPLLGRDSLECHQMPGDVLIVPKDWGTMALNTRETVSYYRHLDLDDLWPEAVPRIPRKKKN